MKRSIISLFAVVLSCVTLSAHGALIEYLPFNGTLNATVGTNATGVNSPTFGPDQFGNPNSALQSATSPTPSYATVAGGGGLDNLQSGTIYFTAKWTGTQSGGAGSNGDLVARQDNGVFSNDVIGLTTTNPATAHISLQLYNTGVTLTGSSVVGDGVWHNVAVTFTSNGVTGTQTLYVDGQVAGTSSVAGTISSNAGTALAIGAWGGDGNGFSNSSLNDFRVYNTVLTQAQIQAIPEPSSVVLFGLGAAGLVLAARRRRKA